MNDKDTLKWLLSNGGKLIRKKLLPLGCKCKVSAESSGFFVDYHITGDNCEVCMHLEKEPFLGLDTEKDLARYFWIEFKRVLGSSNAVVIEMKGDTDGH